MSLIDALAQTQPAICIACKDTKVCIQLSHVVRVEHTENSESLLIVCQDKPLKLIFATPAGAADVFARLCEALSATTIRARDATIASGGTKVLG